MTGELSIAFTGTDPGESNVALSSTGTGNVSSSSVWSAGSYKATLLEAGAPVPGVPTADLTVGDGCTVTSAVAPTPSGVALSSGHRMRRESLRSARTLPPVWHAGQYVTS